MEPKIDFKKISSLFNSSLHNEMKKGKKYLNKIDKVLNDSFGKLEPHSDMTIMNLMDELYDMLKRDYRCEYVYKNAIIHKLLLGKYSLNTTMYLNELSVDNSKADLVFLNGTSTVYEIKTELDSLERLERQICSYSKAFEYIYIVTDEKNIEKILEIVPEYVGVKVLSKRYTLKLIREAKSNKKNIDKNVIFNFLRKGEYTQLINDVYGYIPNVPNYKMYGECKRLFNDIELDLAHELVINKIKKRSLLDEQVNIVRKVPNSLKLFVLYKQLNRKECLNLDAALNQTIYT